MKKRILLGALLLVLGGASLAEDSAVLHIRKEYQSIQNALPSLKAQSLPLSGYSTEGGEAKAYRDAKGDIRLLKVQLFFESGKVLQEFYYQNRMLIFALYQSHRYNVPFHVTPQVAKEIGGEAFNPKKTALTEDRYYFNRGRMIRWINEGRTEVQPGSKEFKDAEADVAGASSEMLSEFRGSN